LEGDLKKEYKFNLNRTINRLVIVVSIGIVMHLVFLLLTNEQNVFQYLHNIKIPYLILIICLLLYNWIGHATRIVIWTRYLKQQLKFKDALRIAIYTELGAAVTPTLIGGGPIKLGLLMKNGLSTGKAGFLTLLGGLEDFIMYTMVFIISFFHARESVFKIFSSIANSIKHNWVRVSIILTILLVIYWILESFDLLKGRSLIPKKYRKSWSKFIQELKGGWHEMLASFNKVRKDGLRYFIVSFIILISQWMSRLSVLVILLWALGIAFKPFQVYIQQWIVYLTMIFIPTPGATGGAEATFFLLFEKQIPKDLLPLIISTWRFFMYYLMLFLSVFLIQFFKFKDHSPLESENING
jgi:uncharacterized protein (TIRG00374 family)